MDFNYRGKVNNSRFEFGLLEKFNFSTFCWPKANLFVSVMKPFNSCKQVSCRRSAVFLLCLVDSSPKISALRNSTFIRRDSVCLRHTETEPARSYGPKPLVNANLPPVQP